MAEGKKHKATVVVFLSFNCPISNRYIPVLGDLASKHAKNDVIFIGIPDQNDPAEVKKLALEFKASFPMHYDPENKVADAFLAKTSPEAFLLDSNLTLRYFGAIDDQYADRTTRLPQARTRHLDEAIQAVVDGKGVPVKHAAANGCPLERARKSAPATGAITFHRDVQPIINTRCLQCHRKGDVAPFELATYDDAYAWADDIKTFVANRTMPPWHLTAGVPMRNDISLSESEISTIVKWVEGGSPRGNQADAPKAPEFPPGDRWDDNDPPDVVMKLPGQFHLGALGEDHYRTFVFPLNNKEEKYVRKSQFIPGNKKIVHHSLLFYDGVGLVLDAQKRLGNTKPRHPGDMDFGPGYESGMGLGFIPDPRNIKKNQDNAGSGLSGWVPGTGALANPPGACHVIPPDSNLLFQTHYHRSGKPEIDADSRIAVWFSKEKPAKFVKGKLLDTSFRYIPKGSAGFRSNGSLEFKEDCELWCLAPHMHMLGKEMRIWLQPAGSSSRQLVLQLERWDFNWQSRYILKDPIPMKKGARLLVEAVFDNSTGNPSNPNHPPKTVYLGESTEDEMGFVVVGIMTDSRPNGTTDFFNYFEKMLEANTLRKLMEKR